jgi:hypothetical protein
MKCPALRVIPGLDIFHGANRVWTWFANQPFTIMKTTIVSVVLVSMIAWVCLAQSQPTASKHEPNGGYVSDEVAANEIAKVVLSRLLTPDDFKKKVIFYATLKDGVWTVNCDEAYHRLHAIVVIQLRQQSGSIIKYENPGA